jgi:hypothetical protein
MKGFKFALNYKGFWIAQPIHACKPFKFNPHMPFKQHLAQNSHVVIGNRN